MMEILETSLQVSVLILFVWALRSLKIRVLPRRTFLALWGVALAKLLIPFSIPSPFSMDAVLERTAGINIGAALPSAVPGDPETLEGGIFPFYSNSSVNEWHILWLLGGCITLTVFLIRNIRSYQMVSDALPVKDNEQIARWMGNRKSLFTVRVLTSDKLPTPVTYGLIRPKIVLPKQLTCSDDPSIRFVFAHEMTHIRRLDVLWKFIVLSAVCVHWFNPLVWVMAALFNRDLEIACDEKVIALYGKGAKEEYATTLIDWSERKPAKFRLCTAFGEGHTKERVISIMKYKKKPVMAIFAAAVLVIGATVFFVASNIGAPNTGALNMGRSLVVRECSRLSIFSDNSAYDMGINPYGMPIFKNTDKALKQAMMDYADGFRAVQEQYHLKPVSKSYWKKYKTLSGQLVPDNSAAAAQGNKIEGFFDIYENSFTDE